MGTEGGKPRELRTLRLFVPDHVGGPEPASSGRPVAGFAHPGTSPWLAGSSTRLGLRYVSVKCWIIMGFCNALHTRQGFDEDNCGCLDTI